MMVRTMHARSGRRSKELLCQSFPSSVMFDFGLTEFATEQGGLSVDVIKNAFSTTEEEFCHLVKQALPISPQIAFVGSCCLLGVISNNVLYVANLGDSRVVLGRRDTESKNYPVVAERLSTDHNVADEEVRREVEALHPDDSHIVVYTRGVWRIKGIIQVGAIVSYYKIPLKQVLVIIDELDLPFAKLRLLLKGGRGGHNGSGLTSYWIYKLTCHCCFEYHGQNLTWEKVDLVQFLKISLLEECRLLDRALEELHKIDPKIVDKVFLGGYDKEQKAAIHQRYLFHTEEKVS
ncbi:hypothetical protein RIF29_20687 [Crotalaria pallida]|uniref:PPM-type phosphatase domain-containing protein n=1 Tax=Crotalaria pallida TaxID=3830 RepID=A0AAN9F627_CROPI